MPQGKNSSPNLDLNKILLTGENSFIRLQEKDSSPITTKAAHWRILQGNLGRIARAVRAHESDLRSPQD